MWDDKLAGLYDDGVSKVRGMPLPSKFKDSDGEHPDGTGELSRFKTDTLNETHGLGDSNQLDERELELVRRAAIRDMAVHRCSTAEGALVLKCAKAKDSAPNSVVLSTGGGAKRKLSRLYSDATESTSPAGQQQRVATGPRKKIKAASNADMEAVLADKDTKKSGGDDAMAEEEAANLAMVIVGGEHAVAQVVVLEEAMVVCSNRDETAAFAWRHKCRIFIKSMTSVLQIQAVNRTEFNKMHNCIRDRLLPKAIKKYKKLTDDKVFELIKNKQPMPDTPESVLHDDDCALLSSHLTSLSSFLTFFADVLKAMGGASSVMLKDVIIRSATYTVWSLPPCMYPLLLDCILAEIFATKSYDGMLQRLLSTSSCLEKLADDDSIDAGIVDEESRAGLRRKWINIALLELTCAYPARIELLIAMAAVRSFLSPLADVHGLQHDASWKFLECAQAMFALCDQSVDATTGTLQSHCHVFASPECHSLMPCSSTEFGVAVSGRVGKHLIQAATEKDAQTELTALRFEFKDLPLVELVPDHQLQSRISAVVEIVKTGLRIRSASNSGFLGDSLHAFEEIDTVRKNYAAALLLRLGDMFARGLASRFSLLNGDNDTDITIDADNEDPFCVGSTQHSAAVNVSCLCNSLVGAKPDKSMQLFDHGVNRRRAIFNTLQAKKEFPLTRNSQLNE